MELSFDTVTLGLIWFVVFLFSTTCHEAAHAFVAKLGGDTTASGQITFNPLPHVQREPFGMVVVPIISYVLGVWMMGWASAPYDPLWAFRHPHRAARMALAGLAANFILMLVGAATIRIGIAVGTFQAPATVTFTRITEATDPSGIGSLLAIFFSVLFVLNLILGAFNLLPVPPLDGHWILFRYLPPRYAEMLAAIRPYGFFILIALLWTGAIRIIIWLPWTVMTGFLRNLVNLAVATF